ncbi:MAG: inositol monophosphatase family protein [Nitrospinaceae bacterium]
MHEFLEAKDTALSWLGPARREVMKWFRGDYAVETKADQSPVTQADRRVEAMLRRRIQKAFPGHGIIGEEFGPEADDKEWVWTVDPIDGTRSFILGLPLFATLLALLHKGEPVLGILSLPALGETAWAVRGQGAWCGSKRLQVSSQTTLEGATLASGDFYCFQTQGKIRLWDRLHRQAQLVRTYPDAFGHLLAVRGAVDAMIDPLAYIWDFAPCKILVQEAGGVFANFSGKKGDIREGTALSGNRKLVKQLQDLAAQT